MAARLVRLNQKAFLIGPHLPVHDPVTIFQGFPGNVHFEEIFVTCYAV